MSDNGSNIELLASSDFAPVMSSDEICFGEDATLCLTDVVNSKASTDHTHSEYALQENLELLEDVVATKANASHTHTGYVSSDDLQLLEDVVATKADANHTHTGYAEVSHTHDDYATQVALDTLGNEVAGKADATHSHSEYAEVDHSHSEYAASSHSHDNYSLTSHIHDYASPDHTHSEYSAVGHDHDEDYASLSHSHSDYATTTSLDTLSATVATKADSSHTHTGVYDAVGSAADALISANAYTDSKIDALVGTGASTTLDTIGEISSAIEDNQDAIDLLNAAIGNKANVTDLTAHAGDAEIHITATERVTWNAKSDFSGSYNDLTNKPAIPSIAGLATETYVDEKVDAITAESIDALPNTTVIPTVPTNISAFVNDAGYLTEHQSLAGLATEIYVDTQIEAIDIPSALSDLTTDSTHRVVTDAEKTAWNAKSNFSGSYNDLTDKPSIPSVSGLATETYVDEAVSTKANSAHTHAISDVTSLQNALDAKAASAHTHVVSDVTGLQSALDSKAASGHNHNDIYYTETEVDSLLSGKSDATHNHDASYDVLGAAETKANEVQANLDTVSDELEAHVANDDIHFTAAERTKLNGIAAGANNYSHPNSGVTAGTYKSVTVNAQGHVTAGTNPTTLAGYGITDAESKGAASSALTSAKAYADELIADEVAARDAAIATAKSSAISTASSDATTKANNALASAKTYADSVGETIKNDLLGNAGTAYDTLKELGDLIDENMDAISALETVAAGKANASHTHAISDVSGLQTALDGKAASSHGTHVSYSTTAPVMDGTASVGSASTVARSDHKHPTDTSRAAQTSLDSHTSNKSNPHGVSLTQLGITATAAELNKLDGVTATTTELNYVDGVTSNIQTQLNGKAANSHTHSAATTSAAGLMSASDKAKLDGVASGANAYTLPTASSTLGGVKTTSTVTSASGYTACPIISGIPYYKDTNTTYSLGSFGITATAAELNYVDGVTSNIQTQLNGKASASHTHNYAGSSSAGGAATSANKLNTNAGSATQPVYFANGVPVVCTYTLGKSVPSDAKFTDTTYSVATASANGLMSASDKSKLDAMVIATVSEVETYLGI